MSHEMQYHRLPAVSRTTGVSIDFLRKEIRRGHLPASKIGRCVVIDSDDLRKYIDTRRVQTPVMAGVTR